MEHVFGLCPELQRRHDDFVALFWERQPVDPIILELCRLRVAQILGVGADGDGVHDAARQAGLDDGHIRALDGWRTSDAFSDTARACLAFAEQFVLDPHGVTDEDAEAVTARLGEPGLIAFVEALALFDGFTRFRAMLGIGGSGGAAPER